MLFRLITVAAVLVTAFLCQPRESAAAVYVNTYWNNSYTTCDWTGRYCTTYHHPPVVTVPRVRPFRYVPPTRHRTSYRTYHYPNRHRVERRSRHYHW